MEKKQGWKKNLTVPNALSVLRLLVIAPFVVFFIQEKYGLAALMLLVSGLSDMLDGWIARRFHQFTPLGAMLDPVADKLTLAAVVICMGLAIPITIPLVILLILKELSMLIAGGVLLKLHKRPPAARWYGKVATVVFYVSMTVIVTMKAIWSQENDVLIIILLSITAACMIFALVKYFLVFLEIIRTKDDDLSASKEPPHADAKKEKQNL